MRQLFSLFEALPTSEDEDSGLYQTREGAKPRHSWDQLEWAFTHPKELAPAQRESLILLPRFALDSLAHEQMVIRAKGKNRTLSPVVKGTAEEVFQAYDQYVANVFDPELPELHVRGKAMMSFVAIATALAACGPVVTPKPTEQSPIAPVVTLVTPTETTIPTVTRTPTEANTPTETAIPTPDFYKGLPPSRAEFVRITPEQAYLKAADILAHPGLTGKPKKKYGVETANGGANIFVTGFYGDSCLIDTGATIINPDGGPDMDVLFIEFLDPDGTHRVAVVCFDGVYKNYITEAADNQLNRLQRVEKGQALIVDMTTILGEENPNHPWNPAAMGLTDNAPDKNKTLFKNLRQSGQRGGIDILPDGIEQIIWYGAFTVGPVPQSK
jgi:hypothetical protein